MKKSGFMFGDELMKSVKIQIWANQINTVANKTMNEVYYVWYCVWDNIPDSIHPKVYNQLRKSVLDILYEIS